MEWVMWTRIGSVRETPLPSLNSMYAWWVQTPVWRTEVNLGCCFSPSVFGWSLGIGFSCRNNKNYKIFPLFITDLKDSCLELVNIPQKET